MRTPTFLSIVALSSSVSATVYKGFNYGSTFTDGSVKNQTDFQDEFNAAKNLVGTSGGFTSARLYTMIVCSPLKPELEIISLPTSEHILIILLCSKVAQHQIRSQPFPQPSPKKHLFFSEYGDQADKPK
jgi:glucan endo-1,3-beta-D-glucosidase